MTLPETAMGFDAVSGEYDRDFGANPIGHWMRRRVWRRLFAAFPGDSRLLEIGCGTGIDAVELARWGRRVTAVDVSPRMVDICRDRVLVSGLAGRVRAVVADLESGDVPGDVLEGAPYDGIFSNFGPLNCVGDLPGLSEVLSRLVRPGAFFLACVMTRPCLWETAYFLLRGRPGEAFRRFHRGGVDVRLGSYRVKTYYDSAAGFNRAFSSRFRLRRMTGLGVFVPPPYLHRLLHSMDGPFRLACRLEERLASRQPLAALGDHTLLEMTRRRGKG